VQVLRNYLSERRKIVNGKNNTFYVQHNWLFVVRFLIQVNKRDKMRKYPKAKYIQQFTMVPNSGPFVRPRERKTERKKERKKERKSLD
jgi:hypothetical protein